MKIENHILRLTILSFMGVIPVLKDFDACTLSRSVRLLFSLLKLSPRFSRLAS